MSLFATMRVSDLVLTRVARWYICKPKIPIWVNLGGSCNRDGVIFYVHFVYFKAILYSLWPFRIIHGRLVPFSRFGLLHQEKSGSPGADPHFPMFRIFHLSYLFSNFFSYLLFCISHFLR
jgi:hypothetical protein